MTTSKRWSSGALLIAAMLASSCGVTEPVRRHFDEVTAAYPVPTRLDGEPQRSGLLLLDAVGKKALNVLVMTGAVIAPENDPESIIRAGSFGTGGFLGLGQPSGVVVFSGLAPGRYRLISVRIENINQWESVRMPTTGAFVIDIAAGEPRYVGQIEIRHPLGSTSRVIELKYEQRREAQAWKWLVERYADSAWSDAIRGRIQQSTRWPGEAARS